MSDVSQGPDYWLASDGKWYPPADPVPDGPKKRRTWLIVAGAVIGVFVLLGIIGAVFGFLNGGGPALVVGLVVCALAVCEITAREHFSGYRSHTALLAALPAVAIEATLVAIFGEPKQRGLLLVVVVPVFAILFWLLRRRFLTARQARVARSARGGVPLS